MKISFSDELLSQVNTLKVDKVRLENSLKRYNTLFECINAYLDEIGIENDKGLDLLARIKEAINDGKTGR